jgi:hypothetical protein
MATIGKARHTEDLVANVVLPDEVAKKLLVDAGLVHDLYMLAHIRQGEQPTCSSIPKSPPELDSFQ